MGRHCSLIIAFVEYAIRSFPALSAGTYTPRCFRENKRFDEHDVMFAYSWGSTLFSDGQCGMGVILLCIFCEVEVEGGSHSGSEC